MLPNVAKLANGESNFDCKFPYESVPTLHFISITELQDQVIRKKLPYFKWQGQVRELENVIERAMIFCESDQIKVEDLPDHVSDQPQERFVIDYDQPLKKAVRNFERHFIYKKLQLGQGRRAQILKEMGIIESTFTAKLRSWK